MGNRLENVLPALLGHLESSFTQDQRHLGLDTGNRQPAPLGFQASLLVDGPSERKYVGDLLAVKEAFSARRAIRGVPLLQTTWTVGHQIALTVIPPIVSVVQVRSKRVK